MQYRNDRYGNPLSVLGFGCMRFAKKGNAIDMEQADEALRPLPYKIGINLVRAFMFRGNRKQS